MPFKGTHTRRKFHRTALHKTGYLNGCKIKYLDGITARVLHEATSSNGWSVVSAAADETLRVWLQHSLLAVFRWIDAECYRSLAVKSTFDQRR